LWGHAGGTDYESEDDDELAFFTYWPLVREQNDHHRG
jgi:hypothetical protein